MAKEIERKFLVVDEKYKLEAVCATEIVQGYISSDPERTVRVRLKGGVAYLTVKGITAGYERDEWEFEISEHDAREMLERLCNPILSKTRYIVRCGNLDWEVDEFHGNLTGLTVAEVELPSAGYVLTELPDFIGREVSGDDRYYNSNLVGLQSPPPVK